MPGMLRKAAITAAATGSTFLGLTTFKLYDLKQHAVIARCSSNGKPSAYLEKLPTRQEHLKSLQETPEYDLLVIGGGATGTYLRNFWRRYSTEPAYANLTQTAHHGLDLISKFSKPQRNRNFTGILLHQFTLVSKFCHGFAFAKVWVRPTRSIFVLRFNWNFKTQSAVSVQITTLFLHSATSVIRIGPNIRKKILCSWRKVETPIVTQVNRPIKARTPSVIRVLWIFIHPQQWDGTFENRYSCW